MGLRPRRPGHRGLKSRLVAGFAALVAASIGTILVQARTPDPAVNAPTAVASSTVAASALPPQGREVLAQIHQGGPFRYEKDGTVFFNRERLLPANPRGYYREYTVPTPGLKHRGARRIVCGGERPAKPDACYYTEDHYASFRLIVQ